MTLLTTWPEAGPHIVKRRTDDPTEIASALAALGLRYEQWPIREELPEDVGGQAALAAYAPEIDRLNSEEGFATVDVVSLHPSDAPEWPDTAKAAREKFLSEHTHDDDDEVRFFVAGAGVFYLRLGGEVHAVLCERGDLLGVPRGTRHWFDMGVRPSFTAIRFFHEEDGWVATFTGDDIAERFPDFDEIVAGRAG